MNPKPKVVKKVMAWGLKGITGEIGTRAYPTKQEALSIFSSAIKYGDCKLVRVEIREVKR